MRVQQRRPATKVRDGKVSRKNRTGLSHHYSQVRQAETVIDRRKPGEGFRHYLRKDDVRRFIGILPDWEQLSQGLDAIVLDEGGDQMGWCWDGVVAVCAWERELAQSWDTDFADAHKVVLDRLGVECRIAPRDSRSTICTFTEWAIRGFQLMHILLHELGHHHDRMTTRTKTSAARGEPFAERYALRYAERLWDDFFRAFPGR